MRTSRLTTSRVTVSFATAALLLAATLLLAFGAGQSLAAGGWLPAQPAGSFSEGDFPNSEELAPAINQAGAEAVGWTTGGSGDAVVSIRRPGAAGFVQQTIDPGSASEKSADLRLAIDQAGDVLAVWQEYHTAESTSSVDYALIAADGSTTGPAEVPGALTKGFEEATVQYLSDGQGLIAWYMSGDNAIKYLRVTGATLGETFEILTEAEPDGWAFDESGGALRAAWGEEIKAISGESVTGKIEATSIAGNGVTAAAQTVEETAVSCPLVNEQCDVFAWGFQFHVHGAGETLTWTTSIDVTEPGQNYEGVSFALKAADATPGAPFGAPQTVIEDKDEQYMHEDVAALAGGGLLACWDEEVVVEAGTILCSARAPGAASWMSPQTIATSSEATTTDQPQIVPAGEDAYVLYGGRGRPPMAQRVSASGNPEGTPFPLTSDPHEADPPIAANDGAGDGLAAWMPQSGGEDIVDTASYDAGPRLTGFSVPASLAEAALGTFGVAVTDPLSPIASIDWSFGDGGSAQGAGVTHAYGSPGTQTATVTATDAAGLSSSLSGTTTVTAVSHAESRLRATLRIVTKRLRSLLKGGLQLKVGCTQACKLAIKLQVQSKVAKKLHLSARTAMAAKRPARKHAAHRKQRPVVLAHKSLTLKAAGSRKVDLKLTKKLRKRLAKVHKLKLTVVVQASSSGQHAKVSKTVTLH